MFGNKISSYGGNLTVRQAGAGRGRRMQESLAIMRGAGVSLHYLSDQPVTGDTTTSIPLTERDWVRVEDGMTRPATRQDMLRVLSNIEVSSGPGKCPLSVPFSRLSTYERAPVSGSERSASVRLLSMWRHLRRQTSPLRRVRLR